MLIKGRINMVTPSIVAMYEFFSPKVTVKNDITYGMTYIRNVPYNNFHLCVHFQLCFAICDATFESFIELTVSRDLKKKTVRSMDVNRATKDRLGRGELGQNEGSEQITEPRWSATLSSCTQREASGTQRAHGYGMRASRYGSLAATVQPRQGLMVLRYFPTGYGTGSRKKRRAPIQGAASGPKVTHRT
ncbi:uncharacterized protein LOC143147419 [Ptiloglossa arizonensis]|uniref:uncharacterized protein LOC143147419 n=1 Tax=Ptiloglossa arizonensis TaxID=3350558 RepID=UPI003FA17C50